MSIIDTIHSVIAFPMNINGISALIALSDNVFAASVCPSVCLAVF